MREYSIQDNSGPINEASYETLEDALRTLDEVIADGYDEAVIVEGERDGDSYDDMALIYPDGHREDLKKNIWYAIQKDDDDQDWGSGSHDYQEAMRMAKEMGCKKIAVIEMGNDPICIEERMVEE